MPDKFYNILGTTFGWDEDKNEKNIKKHGISFKTAALIFNDDFRIEIEDRWNSSEEERYDAIGLVDNVLFVVFCEREDADTGRPYTRIISARPATKQEANLYNNNISGRL